MSETGGTLDRALAWDGDPCGELARLTGAQNALVIGATAAVAVAAVAAAIGPDGVVVACDPGPGPAFGPGPDPAPGPGPVAVARDAFDRDAGQRARIDVWLGPVRETLAALAEASESFDLIFIDADTSGSWSYLATILNAELLAPNGLLCAEYAIDRSAAARSIVTRAAIGFNATLARDLRVEQLTLAGRDGQTLARWAR